jgi:hypothetical protein
MVATTRRLQIESAIDVVKRAPPFLPLFRRTGPAIPGCVSGERFISSIPCPKCSPPRGILRANRFGSSQRLRHLLAPRPRAALNNSYDLGAANSAAMTCERLIPISLSTMSLSSKLAYLARLFCSRRSFQRCFRLEKLIWFAYVMSLTLSRSHACLTLEMGLGTGIRSDVRHNLSLFLHVRIFGPSASLFSLDFLPTMARFFFVCLAVRPGHVRFSRRAAVTSRRS